MSNKQGAKYVLQILLLARAMMSTFLEAGRAREKWKQEKNFAAGIVCPSKLETSSFILSSKVILIDQTILGC